MNKAKKFLLTAFSLLAVTAGALGFASCGEKGEKGDTGAQGEQGVQGEKGEKGEDGQDGVGIEKVEYDEDGNLVITLTDGTKQTVEMPEKEEEITESLQYQKIAGKDEYRVIGLGTVSDLDIVIPSTYRGLPVTEIGESSFAKEYYITSIIIPDSVTSIGRKAFDNCSSLTSVAIGNGVTSIGSAAFLSCHSLTSITVSENNAAYKSIDGNLYTKDGKTIVQYAKGKTANSFTIPDGVTSIGDYAFYNCSRLISIVIPDGVTFIYESAFDYCASLTSIELPDSVTYIGIHAFYFCDKLTSVVIGDSVTSIEYYAFDRCDSLTSVYYKGTTEAWAEIEIGSYGNSYLTDATLYYYSEEEPTDEGNYWHYDENDEVVVW